MALAMGKTSLSVLLSVAMAMDEEGPNGLNASNQEQFNKITRHRMKKSMQRTLPFVFSEAPTNRMRDKLILSGTTNDDEGSFFHQQSQLQSKSTTTTTQTIPALQGSQSRSRSRSRLNSDAKVDKRRTKSGRDRSTWNSIGLKRGCQNANCKTTGSRLAKCTGPDGARTLCRGCGTRYSHGLLKDYFRKDQSEVALRYPDLSAKTDQMIAAETEVKAEKARIYRLRNSSSSSESENGSTTGPENKSKSKVRSRNDADADTSCQNSSCKSGNSALFTGPSGSQSLCSDCHLEWISDLGYNNNHHDGFAVLREAQFGLRRLSTDSNLTSDGSNDGNAQEGHTHERKRRRKE